MATLTIPGKPAFSQTVRRKGMKGHRVAAIAARNTLGAVGTCLRKITP